MYKPADRVTGEVLGFKETKPLFPSSSVFSGVLRFASPQFCRIGMNRAHDFFSSMIVDKFIKFITLAYFDLNYLKC